MRIECPHKEIRNPCTLKNDFEQCSEYDNRCHKEATAADLISALKELRPDCEKCEAYDESDIPETCNNCMWFKFQNNFKEKKP
jgi:hypothetical protein